MLKRRFFVTLLALFVVISAAVKVFAADPTIAFNRTGSLSLTLRAGSPVSGAAIRVYKVAELDNAAESGYTLTPDFAASSVKLNNFTGSDISNHLAAYAAQNNLSGIEQITNTMGIAHFDSLELGLYLAVQVGGATGFYPIDPFLVSIPMTSTDGTDWLYEVDATPKIQSRPTFTDTTELTVKKEWQDSGENHPNSVKITLLCDGEIYDTVTLNPENSWTYAWQSLNTGHTWSAVETDVPDGYTVTYTEADSVVTITNTANEEPTYESLSVKKLWSDGGSATRPTSVKVDLLRNSQVFDTVTLSNLNNWSYTWDELDPNATWGVRETDVPDGYTPSYTVENNSVTITNTAKTLIQTGQLNWPIPFLACGGALIFTVGVGISLRRKKSHEK